MGCRRIGFWLRGEEYSSKFLEVCHPNLEIKPDIIDFSDPILDLSKKSTPHFKPLKLINSYNQVIW